MSESVFFVSGGTLPLSAESYVERAADRDLFDALAQGRYAYVLNARQMGKSSLCVRTIARLESQGVRAAFVDLTRIGGRNVTPDQWYIGILGEIGRAVGARAGLVAYWKENPDVSPMQRFFGALAAYALPEGAPPLVVFVDEVDATRSLPFSADEFFGGVRECFNRRAHDPAFESLTFCLLGAALPSDLIREMEASPFNVGERIAVKDFTLDEATAFAAGLSRTLPLGGGQGGGTKTAQALVARVHHWTAGHPFLTQSLCRRLAETGATVPADVDRLVESDLFAPSARESNVNLADVGNRVLLSSDGEDPDRHRAEILALYARIRKRKKVEDDESNPRIAILKLSGLVVAEEGLLRLRNRVYERVFGPAWIAEHMPDGEARRVKRAYRVGLFRAAAAGAALLAVVGALGLDAVRSQGRAENLLAQVQKERDHALVAERRATVSALQANEQKTRAEGLAVERTKALTVAKRDRDRAAASASLERLARQGAQAATAQERIASRNALASARRAVAAGKAERVAALLARRQTVVAIAATGKAKTQRNLAERLLYDSDLQLAQIDVNENHGPQAARILDATRAPAGMPNWVQRRLRTQVSEGLTVGGSLGEIGRTAFAPNGDLLTLDDFFYVPGYQFRVAGPRGTVRRYSHVDGRLLDSLALGDVPGGTSIDVAPDGASVAVSTAQGAVRLYSPDGFRLQKTLPGDGVALSRLQFTAAPGRLLARKGYHQVAVDLGTGRVQDLGMLGAIEPSYEPSAMLPNGDVLAEESIGSVRNRLVCRAPVPEGGRDRWSYTPPAESTLLELAVSSDAKRVAVASFDGHVAVLDAETGAVVYSLGQYPSPVHALAFDSSGTRLAEGAEDGTVRIVDLTTGRERITLTTPRRDVTSLTYARDGDALAIGNADGTATRRDLTRSFASASGTTEVGIYSRTLALSFDGKVLAYGGKSVGLIDAHSGRPLRSFSPPGDSIGVDLSGDGKTVAALGSDAVLRAWMVADGRLLLEAPVSLDRFSPGSTGGNVALSPDGRVAVAYVGGHALQGGAASPQWKVIDLANGRDLTRRYGEDNGTVSQVAFSRDGTRFAVAWSGGDVRIYHAKTRALLRILPNPRGDRAWSLAYDADGTMLAVGRQSGWIDLYDARTGRTMRSWPAHEGWLEALAFCADGTTLVSSGRDRTTRTWDVATGRSLGLATDYFAFALASAPKGDVYALANALIYAMRLDPVRRVAPARPSVSDRQAFDATRDRARGTGRAVLLVALFPFDSPFERMVRTLLDDPVAGPVLKRRFEVCEVGRSAPRLGVTEASADTDRWRRTLPALGAESISVVRPDGRVVWTGGLLTPDGVPESDPSSFLDGLRHGAPAMSPAEIATIRAALDRVRAPFAGRYGSYKSAIAGVNAAAQAGDFKAALDQAAAYSAQTVAPPIDFQHIREGFWGEMQGLARTGRMKEAADLMTWALRRTGYDASVFTYAAIAYGLVGDDEGLRALRDLAPRSSAYPDSLSGEFALALAPGGLADPKSLLERLPRPAPDHAAELTLQVLLTLRAGRFAEAEAEARRVIEMTGATLSDPPEQRYVQLFLALALAHEGKTAEARAELALAETTPSGAPSDAAFIARDDQPDPSAFVLLRREIRGLIDK